MKLKLKVEGIKRTRMMLRSIGEKVPETARKQMHRSAAHVVERAKLYVPEDTTALRESIRIERSYGTRGRLQIDVIAGHASYFNAAGRIINLDQYAWVIHEKYRDFRPGKNTKAKREANPGVYIGEKFLERAVLEELPALQRNIIDAVTQIIRRENKTK